MIWADSLGAMEEIPAKSFDLVVADPPYSEFPLINEAVDSARWICRGPVLVFMYAEDLLQLTPAPDQVAFWVKPISTKNTSRRYSRFVEVLACFDLDQGPFRQDTHWSTRSGVFTDTLVEKQKHPYQKPESLIEKLLAVHTNKGDWVLDPFAGSGTVERVCKRMERNCLSIDIDQRWAHER